MPQSFQAHRRTRTRRDPQNGGAVVEFAIVLPIFLTMLFGIIDYGWYFYQKFTLASAVQGGLREAVSIREIDSPDTWRAAKQAAQANLDSSGAIAKTSVTWGPADEDASGKQPDPTNYTGVKPNRAVILTGTYTFIPLVGLVRLPSTTLKYSGTMLLDGQNGQI